MAKIHVDTDVMRQLSSSFYQVNEDIEDNALPAIRGGISQLEADWSGASRVKFEQLFHDWELHAKQLAELGEHISKHLQSTADAFDQADQP